MIDDEVIARLGDRINAIYEICKANIKPWEPNSAWRAQNLFRELVEPYIEYMATRPKAEFPVPWCNAVEDLVPVGETENYLD